ERFSGADPQALVNNIRLALVHADIGAHAGLAEKHEDASQEQKAEFAKFGGMGRKGRDKAEEDEESGRGDGGPSPRRGRSMTSC
ncbi:unnamed protein product, partial [Peniophora sp. CBMAI 1063]